MDNLWTTLRSRAQLIHILAIRLTMSVRCQLSQRAGVPDSSRVRSHLMPALCLILGSNLIQAIPASAASSADHFKLYAHSRILHDKSYQCFYKIIHKESRWNPQAKNGSHYGLGQMRSQWYRDLDPYRQIDETLRYITKRYKTPCLAWEFHKRNGYF